MPSAATEKYENTKTCFLYGFYLHLPRCKLPACCKKACFSSFQNTTSVLNVGHHCCFSPWHSLGSVIFPRWLWNMQPRTTFHPLTHSPLISGHGRGWKSCWQLLWSKHMRNLADWLRELWARAALCLSKCKSTCACRVSILRQRQRTEKWEISKP